MGDDREKQLQEIAGKILTYDKTSLLMNMRFLGMAMSKLQLRENDVIPFGTDGDTLFYIPEKVVLRYRDCQEDSVRDYLHTLLHCIFCHMYVGGETNHSAWDLACDIAVENIISELDLPLFKSSREDLQKPLFNRLKTEVNYMTAEKLYLYFNGKSEEELDALRLHFCADDHRLWYAHPRASGEGNQEGESENGNGNNDNNDNNGNGNCQNQPQWEESEKDWQNISKHLQEDLTTFSKSRGGQAESLLQNLKELHREKYDYTEFLKKFAVIGEKMKVNDDEFDYIFYTYGLKLYGKMPLIEPLEYKEVKGVRDFVIAIDTSGSCSGDLVQRFLQKTYNILKTQESFFTRFNLHIIQCDTEIQEDAKITSQEDFDNYIKKMELHGFGGTDFRPVFTYVDRLIREKTFTNLKGLIYFTDGYGVFPERQPDYKTAFVFVNDGMDDIDVPTWAIRLVLPEEDI